MTDQELAQAVAERVRLREADAVAMGDKAALKVLRRVHDCLDLVQGMLVDGGMIAPLSGGTPKPPKPE